MAEAINMYMDALNRVYKAKEGQERINIIIGKLHAGLQFPYPLMISGCDIGYSIHKTRNIPYTPQIEILAKDWPSAQEIAEVMKELNEALKAYDDAYSKLNDIEKKGVKYVDI